MIKILFLPSTNLGSGGVMGKRAPVCQWWVQGERENTSRYSPDGQRRKGILERGSNRTKGRKDKAAQRG